MGSGRHNEPGSAGKAGRSAWRHHRPGSPWSRPKQASDRGNEHGAEAVELLTAWLFETGKAERVQPGTDAGNVVMRAVLERLGFQLEGMLRGYGATGDGTRIDGAMYAVLKLAWVLTGPRPACARCKPADVANRRAYCDVAAT
jgi:hypothetical protein